MPWLSAYCLPPALPLPAPAPRCPQMLLIVDVRNRLHSYCENLSK